MAVTKIWDVRGSLDAPIKYVSNEDKTENPNLNDHTEEELQTLDDVIEYAANEDKTEMKYFVSTLNCNKNFARDEFQMAKKRFDKEGGIVAYHGYQSFRPGEVTPSQAHEIGVQMAKELWGDRFQVVIATHVNTRCTHNHIIEGKSDTGFPFFMEKLTNTSFYISFPVANGRVVVKGGSP